MINERLFDQQKRRPTRVASGVVSVDLLDSYRKSATGAEKLRKLARISGEKRTMTSSMLSRRAKQLRDGEIEALVVGYTSGRTMAKLASEFGIHRTTVAQHLLTRGIAPRDTAITADKIDEAVRLYESGLSFVKIGARLGFNAQTISNHLHQRGVAIRGPHERPH
jgi:DNA-binding CsgD family transcriptional regulator